MEKLNGVIVAGAGPVGLVTALKLVRAGIPVTLVEAGTEIIQSPRAVVYHSPTVEELDKLGLLDDMKALGVLKEDYQFRTPQGEILAKWSIDAIRGDTNYPFNLHLGQNTMAEVILKHLLREPGIDVRWSHQVTAVEQDADRVTVTVETPEGTKRLNAPWLVGADGARSGVRRALGLRFDGHTWPARMVSTNVYYDFEKYGFAKANFIVHPQYYWGVIVKINNNGLWRVTYGEDGALSDEEAIARVPEVYKMLLPGNEPYRIDAIAPFRVHERCAETFRVGRVLLAGDAAHINNPCGGLGLTSGLLDAISLGNVLTAVVHGQAPDGALDAWAEDRREVFLTVTTPTASENLRRLSESDPARKTADMERMHRLNTDPAFQRQALLGVLKLRGNSFPQS